MRSDDIHGALWNTLHRRPLATVRDDDMHETLMGAYVNEEIAPLRWLRLDVGGRADLISFAVDNLLTERRPDRARQRASAPRTSSAPRPA